MRDKNIKDPECQKQLVQTFVNAVFVYDDKVTITFNYSGDKRTVTLAEVDSLGTEGAEFVCRALCSTITHTHEPAPLTIAVWRNVFAISISTQ